MIDEPLTPEEKATNHDTWRHIHRVQFYLNRVITQLIERAHVHDQSKLVAPEVGYFAAVTEKLKGLQYGSEEYRASLLEIKPALDHHFANNRHHPEHYKDGINDMNLLDLIEMFCDWKAAGERQNTGNIRKSLEINAERFGIGPQLLKVFENTIEVLA